jgi:hypothetical protein
MSHEYAWTISSYVIHAASELLDGTGEAGDTTQTDKEPTITAIQSSFSFSELKPRLATFPHQELLYLLAQDGWIPASQTARHHN